MTTFLVIGGTGKVGSRLTRILRNQGHVARAASRTRGDVRFDWRDRATYPAALAGVDGIFVVGPGSATDWSEDLAALLAIAADARARHVVLLSARGVEFLPEGAAARAERTLVGGPVPWTVLRPTHFAQNFTEAMFVPQDDVVTAPVASGTEPFVDVDDIAEVAAGVLTNPVWIGDTIDISGPEALSFDDAVGILGRHSRRSLRFEDEELDSHAHRLRRANTPEGYVAWRMAMLGAIRRGDDAYLSDGVERVLGRPATPFSDWAAREAFVLAMTG